MNRTAEKAGIGIRTITASGLISVMRPGVVVDWKWGGRKKVLLLARYRDSRQDRGTQQ